MKRRKTNRRSISLTQDRPWKRGHPTWEISSASAAFAADAAAVKAEGPLSPRAGFALRKPRAHSRLDEGVL